MITYITNALKNHRNRMWLGVPEAMDYTKCSRTTIYSAVRSGKLKSSKPEGINKIVFRRDWLDSWLGGNSGR